MLAYFERLIDPYPDAPAVPPPQGLVRFIWACSRGARRYVIGMMLLTAINFLPPALGRIGIAPLQALGPLWFFGFPTAIAILCIVLDARRHGRVNRVLVLGTALLIISYVARIALMSTHAWINFASWLTTFV